MSFEQSERPPAGKSPEELEREAVVLYRELIRMPEITEALAFLDRLPERLRYHDKAHTLDVIYETVLFALADGASEKVIKQQAIAAAWHDVGFIEQDEKNEPIAVRLFEQSGAYATLPEDVRNEIIANIADTEVIMENGKPLLLKRHSTFGYALDGDVSNFGRKDFFEKRAKVAEELGVDLTDPEAERKFYAFTLDLLKNHEWKTASARRLRQAQKEENIRLAEEEYAAISSRSGQGTS